MGGVEQVVVVYLQHGTQSTFNGFVHHILAEAGNTVVGNASLFSLFVNIFLDGFHHGLLVGLLVGNGKCHQNGNADNDNSN